MLGYHLIPSVSLRRFDVLTCRCVTRSLPRYCSSYFLSESSDNKDDYNSDRHLLDSRCSQLILQNRIVLELKFIDIYLGLIGTFPFFWWNSGLFEGRCHSRILLSFSYLKFICIFGSFIPTIIIIVFYTLIYKEILKQVEKLS